MPRPPETGAGLDFAGAVLDLAVTDLDRAAAFYTALVGRPHDLRPRADQLEWRLHGVPEIALRLTAEPATAGGGTIALGVADLTAERRRLAGVWGAVPEPVVKPGVITLVRFPDPDGNVVTLWQDLLAGPAPSERHR